MKTTLLLLLVLSPVLFSCEAKDPWPKKERETFVTSCKSSFISSFTSTVGENMHMVNEDELDKLADNFCDCSYETIKSKYESAEEAFQKPTSELMEIADDCEPSDEDINKLLK